MCVKFGLRFVVFSVCVAVTPSVVSAQDLRDSVIYALNNHPAIESAKLGYNAAEHGKDSVVANYFPDVSIGLTAGRTYQDNATSRGLNVTRGAAYSGLGEGNITVRQMLFDGYEVSNRVRSASAKIESLQHSVFDMEGMVVLRLAQSYADILRINSALKIMSEQNARVKDYEDRIIDMVSQGVADEVELQQARDVAMIVDGIKSDYQGQLSSAMAVFAEASGQKYMASKDDKALSLSDFIDDDIDAAVELANANHPALQSARFDSQASRHDMRAEHSRMYPNVDGEISYSKTDKKDEIGGETKDARAVIRMNWSFSTGGRDFSSVRQKRYEHYEVASRSKALEGEIERDIRQSYSNYHTLKHKLLLSQERVELNKKLLSAYEAKFEGARISLLDLMRAESQLFNARLEENDNKYYLISAEYGVLASLGTLKDIIISEPSGE